MGKKQAKKSSNFWDGLKGWKTVETGDELLLGCEEDGFMGLEELNPAEFGDALIIEGEAMGDDDTVLEESKKPSKKAGKKRKDAPADEDGDDDVEALKAKIESLKAENKALKKQKKSEKSKELEKKKDTKEKQPKKGEQKAEQPVPLADVSAWHDYQLHPLVLNALAKMGFSTPTHIQSDCIPAAVRDRRDIIGAAQTGSGKTLAFGIPIMQILLAEKDHQPATDNNKLRALILAPTRELAIQVSNHLKAVGETCGIWTVPIVGGMSAQKQERLLSKKPQIVVATPGRLWELMRDGYPHLTDLTALSFLVIDEADRMVQQGHYSELTSILDSIPRSVLRIIDDEEASDEEERNNGKNKDANKGVGLQTFVFSATLTLPTELRKRLRKGGGGSSSSSSLESLMDKVPFRTANGAKPKIVDLTSDRKLADKVQESHIRCPESERDEYLYCLLNTHPGRTIVFVNAISSVRRLGAILKVLSLPVVTLHAEMQQRQRLKALDRFKEDSNGILVATDVAARGLDIKDVQCVIHYQLPASVDVYVHRSGRTARADAEGIAIALVTPKESQRFSALLRALKREEESPEFPIDMSIMPAVKKRVALAVQLDKLQRVESKAKAEKTWKQQHAEALDIILSSDEEDALSDGDGGKIRGKRVGKKARKEKTKHEENNVDDAQKVRQELAVLLAEPLQASFSRKYFTGGAAAGVAISNQRRDKASEENHHNDDEATKDKKTKQKKQKIEIEGDDDANGMLDGSAAASGAVAMAQRIHNIKNDNKKKQKNQKGGNKSAKKPKGDPRAAALAAELQKRALKKQGKGKQRGLVVIPSGIALGRETSGPSALQALRATL